MRGRIIRYHSGLRVQLCQLRQLAHTYHDGRVRRRPAQRRRDVRFIAPSLRYRSLSDCELHACMDWRAEVRLFGVGGEFTSDDDVFGGYVDFLTLR
jgi:hypothetical protein